jgi:hypothetical protein
VKLQVVRTQFGRDATNGLLFIDGLFECYTLEDQYQEVKIMHETCIPEGTYDVKFRTVGGFHERYKKRYGNSHYGMLHLQNVPGFTYILIHSGNTDEHTSGCLIVGETQQDLDVSEDGFIGSSGKAYVKLYDKIAKQLLIGNPVTIEYSKINLTDSIQQSDSTSVQLDDVQEKLQEINGNVLKLSAKIDGRNII